MISTRFYYGVHTLKTRNVIEVEVTSVERGLYIIQSVRTNEPLGRYTKRKLFRHIKLSECYERNGFEMTREVFELEMASRPVRTISTPWHNRTEQQKAFERDYVNGLEEKEKKQYIARQHYPSTILKQKG